ncbi:hypothetical protein RFM26_15890 [Mesorhizobium sp. VK23B]|uniref:Uncharacterized protein n=1 Tax=Mesorhizobium dulcispinae TaxID=3072316 RepID=A0ABU4XEH5_9HYPH|nr:MULTISPECIES: hypothetical protein [unclassified Mesorhizobium]MDX8467174.1 hypothetical protein [Mesorhizobium sp. VK23B]MDX8473192.1 hypothetical protein [Mesorhizobium sp. VK23A]
MALITLYSTEDGIERLLAQPGDVRARSAPSAAISLENASPEHRQVFADYVNDLKLAYDIAEAWWEDTIESQKDTGLSTKKAIAEAFDVRLAGPASNPHVVWAVRGYWLECDRVNKSVGDALSVPPEILLLRWLIEAHETDLVKLIACMPYWPVGLDEKGEWC